MPRTLIEQTPESRRGIVARALPPQPLGVVRRGLVSYRARRQSDRARWNTRAPHHVVVATPLERSSEQRRTATPAHGWTATSSWGRTLPLRSASGDRQRSAPMAYADRSLPQSSCIKARRPRALAKDSRVIGLCTRLPYGTLGRTTFRGRTRTPTHAGPWSTAATRGHPTQEVLLTALHETKPQTSGLPTLSLRRLRDMVLAGDPGCVCDPELFTGPTDIEPEDEPPEDRAARVAVAREVCASCPVRLACLAYSLRTRPAAGVWAGHDADAGELAYLAAAVRQPAKRTPARPVAREVAA